MRDFGDWFRESADALAATQTKTEESVDLLPVGVWDDDNGKYFTECCCCGRDCDITEYAEDVIRDYKDEEYRHYCGGSERCIP